MGLKIGIYEFGRDDAFAFYNLSCCALGIGSLGMARCYADAGPVYGTIALVLACAMNVYAMTTLSWCLREAPSCVKTYGDLGEYLYGKGGRWVVVVVQTAFCLMVPVAYLVLGGGTILPILLNSVLEKVEPNVYIAAMAITLLPVVYIETLKETAMVAFLGTAGAVIGDVFAVVDSSMNSPYYYNKESEPTVERVVNVFGILMMAYGIVIVLPTIQREHKRPENVPIVSAIVLIVLTLVYITIGLLGFYQYGCNAPPNLLLSMTNPNMERIAMIAFFIHILIAFAVVLNPILYILERYCFGLEDEKASICAMTPITASEIVYMQSNILPSKTPSSTKCFDIKHRLKSYMLRTFVVFGQVLVAMFLQGSFNNVSDLVGSSAMTIAGLIIPNALYFKMFRHRMNLGDKILCCVLLVITAIISVYTSGNYIMNIVHSFSKLQPFQAAPVEASLDIDYSRCLAKPIMVQ